MNLHSNLSRRVAVSWVCAALLFPACDKNDKGSTPEDDAGVDLGTTTDMAVAEAPTNVQVDPVFVSTVGTLTVNSSTELTVTWDAPATGTVDHYIVTATDGIDSSQTETIVDGSEHTVTLTELKSGTGYAVHVAACADSACDEPAVSDPDSDTTAEEVWQFQGTGNSFSGLTEIVSDGNARLSITRFGPEAGADTANRLQLYYGPMPMDMTQSLAVAHTSSDTSASDSSSYLSFTSLAGSSGITSSAATMSTNINGSGIGAGVAVPVSSALGANVMLVFEARGADGFNRIFSINSQDGYTGRDFNAGSGTTCSSTADYSTGGDCELNVLIPVASDPGGNAHIANARQMKLGFPSLTDWRWDGSDGLFMVFTVDNDGGTCTSASHNHAYAVWNGSSWEVQYDSATGCPELFVGAQAAFPLHLGGVRYKMYYGNPSDMTGRLPGMIPFVGPKTIIYADGSSTGDATTVDFDDWESMSDARGITFLWPTGDVLDATEEGYIDDYQAIMPTGDPSLQVLYVAISDGAVPPIAAAAILLNP